MASSKTQLSLALILSLNILLLSNMVSSNPCQTPAVPSKAPKSTPSAPAKQSPAKGAGHSSPVVPESCPRDTLKLGACANLVNGLVNAVVGIPPSSPYCCSLIEGIADLEAAACLCTALKANVLGVVKVKVNVSLSLILNYCGKGVPAGFQCAY